MNEYNADSIETLEFRDAVRKRIGMYLGGADMNGVYQAFQEILSNSIDEFYAGYGKEIEITVGKDWISISDQGRGVPVGKRDDGTEVLEAIFTTPHTGGKFNDKAYQFAAGLNGIGAKATCLSSDEFTVIVSRDGGTHQLIVENGISKGVKFLQKVPKELSGTLVKFKPSAEVFNLEPILFDFNKISNTVKNLSYLTKGLKFIVKDDSNNKTFEFLSDGLESLIEEYAETPIHKTPLRVEVSEKGISVEMVAQWTKGREKSYCFTNGIENIEGGTPITGFRSSVTRTINKIANTSLTGEIIRSGLVYAISVRIPNPSFANQTKTKINNPELRSICDRACGEMIKLFFEERPDERKLIIEKLVKEEKAELAAERARNKILESQKAVTQESKKKGMLPGKLVDCEFHDENSMLMLVEGKSARGGVVNGRDSKYTAVYPLRGKIINALKNPIEDVLDNEEVREIQIALGCGIQDNFDIKKLRYGKIAIMTDADYDGYSIMCLILTFFYKYMPELIRSGYIYWAKTPLYRVRVGKKEYYAYNDEELAALPKGTLQRFKGIGELDPEDLENTLFSPDGQYFQFIMEDAEQASYFFNMLMGENIDERRSYIFNNVDFTAIEE